MFRFTRLPYTVCTYSICIKVKIVELFRDGVRIPHERALECTPIYGELSVDNMAIAAFSGQPHVLAARLRVAYGSQQIKADIIPPLFQVILVKMTPGGFVLR